MPSVPPPPSGALPGSDGEPIDTRELRASRDGEVFTIALESWSGHTNAAIRVDVPAEGGP